MNGVEWVIEAFGCSPEALQNTQTLRSLFDEIIAEMKLRPVSETQWHQFPHTGGITGLCLVSRARLALPQSFLLRAAPRMEFRTRIAKAFRFANGYNSPARPFLRNATRTGGERLMPALPGINQ
jgi:hypothetical protein